ncbi:MAG: methionyl-tRNA formyltransferase [Acidobacteriota bacterium]
MRVVFLGTPSPAATILRALHAAGHEIPAVISPPDRPFGRGRKKMKAPAVKETALELGLPVLQPESIKTVAIRKEVAALRPDVLAVVAYGHLLGPRFLALPRLEPLNVHFSLLPRFRGASPVQRALLAGDERTGVSIMRLVRELDAGPVFSVSETSITDDDDAPGLEARLAELGAEALVGLLPELEAGELEPAEQDEAQVVLAPPLRREEGYLDPRLPASELDRTIRALRPWPGTSVVVGERRLALLEATLPAERRHEAEPGTLLEPDGAALPLACGDGTILNLERVRPEGRAPMDGRSLVVGRHVMVGDRALAPEDPPAAGG